MTQPEATAAAAPTAVTDEACIAACNAESFALPEAGALGGPPAVDRPCVTDAERWWPNRGQDPLAAFDRVSVGYNGRPAVVNVAFPVARGSITALIGPSGSGKSSLIRCMNRMNDLVPSARVDGRVLYRGVDLNGPRIDAVQVRKRIGMVFQKPNRSAPAGSRT